MIPSIKDLPYPDRLERLDLPTLAYRRLGGDMIQVFTIMRGYNDIDRDALCTMKEIDIDLRGHSMKIQKQRAHLNIRKYSFTHELTELWITGICSLNLQLKQHR